MSERDETGRTERLVPPSIPRWVAIATVDAERGLFPVYEVWGFVDGRPWPSYDKPPVCCRRTREEAEEEALRLRRLSGKMYVVGEQV